MDIRFVPKLTAQTVDVNTGELQRAIPPIEPLKQDLTLLPIVAYDNPLQASSNLVRLVPSLLNQETQTTAKEELLELAKKAFTNFQMQTFATYAGLLLERNLIDRKELFLKVSETIFDNLGSIKKLEDELKSKNKEDVKPGFLSLGNRIFPGLNISRFNDMERHLAIYTISENLLTSLKKSAPEERDQLLVKIFIPELMPQVSTVEKSMELQKSDLTTSCCPGLHH